MRRYTPFLAAAVLLLVIACGRTVHGQSPLPPGPTPPYRPQTAAEWQFPQLPICVSEPFQLRGCFGAAIFGTAGSMFVQTDPGSSILRRRVVLPNSADDPYACTPFMFTETDDGTPLRDALVLVERGDGCSFSTKVQNVEVLNLNMTGTIGGVLIHGCSEPSCTPYLTSPFADAAFNSSAVIMTGNDGYRLRDFLLAELQHWQWNNSYVPLPVYVEIEATGSTHPDDIAALRLLAQSLTFDPEVLAASNFLRPFSSVLTQPQLDPCLNRVLGLWCQSGRIVALDLWEIGASGTFPEGSLNMKNLIYFRFDNNPGLTGVLPSCLCGLQQLKVLQVQLCSFQGFPDCLGQNNPSLALVDALQNKLESFPLAIGGAQAMKVLVLSQNGPGLKVPVGKELAFMQALMSLTLLEVLEIDNNPSLRMDASALHVGHLANLQLILLSNTGLFGHLPVDAFDFPLHCNHTTCSNVAEIDLSHTQLAPGPIPNMMGCYQLEIAIFANANFYGNIPRAWTVVAAPKALVRLDLSDNSLNGTYIQLSQLPYIQILNVSSNQLTNYPGLDVGECLSFMISASLLELHASNNKFTGQWLAGWFTTTKLVTLDVSYNSITNLPSQLFTGGSLSSANFAYNNLSGSLPEGSPPLVPTPLEHATSWTLLNLQGNPNLVAWPFPSWMSVLTPPVYQVVGNKRYQCLQLSSAVPSQMSILVDAEFTGFRLCTCARGFFGYPPLCGGLPSVSVSSPYMLPASMEVGSDFATMINDTVLLNGTIPGPDGVPLTPFSQEDLTAACNASTCPTAPFLQYPFALSDFWYGDVRYQAGMSSSFDVDLSYMWVHQNNATNPVEVSLSYNGTSGSGTQDLVPVRAILVRLHLSVPTFSASTTLGVAGTTTANDTLTQVLSLDHLAVADLPLNPSGDANTTEYNQAYASDIAQLIPPVAYVEVIVLGNKAQILYSSRDSSGAHFVATYAPLFHCPDPYVLSEADSPALQSCIIQGTSDETFRRTLYVFAVGAAIVLLLVLMLLAWERYKRQRDKYASQLAEVHEEAHGRSALLSAERLRAVLVATLKNSRRRDALQALAGELAALGADITSSTLNVIVSFQVLLDGTVDPTLRAAFGAVAITSTVGFALNSASRAVVIKTMWAQTVRLAREQDEDDDPLKPQQPREGKPSEGATLPELTRSFDNTRRRLLMLRITGLAVFLQSLPWIALDTVALLKGFHQSVSAQLSLVFAAVLLGVKLQRLRLYSSLSIELASIQLSMFDLQQRQDAPPDGANQPAPAAVVHKQMPLDEAEADMPLAVGTMESKLPLTVRSMSLNDHDKPLQKPLHSY